MVWRQKSPFSVLVHSLVWKYLQCNVFYWKGCKVMFTFFAKEPPSIPPYKPIFSACWTNEISISFSISFTIPENRQEIKIQIKWANEYDYKIQSHNPPHIQTHFLTSLLWKKNVKKWRNERSRRRCGVKEEKGQKDNFCWGHMANTHTQIHFHSFRYDFCIWLCA